MIAARKITKTSNIYCFMVIFRGINSSVRGKCRGGTKQKTRKITVVAQSGAILVIFRVYFRYMPLKQALPFL